VVGCTTVKGGDILGRIEKSVEIKASPEKVWEMLALDRWSEWMDEMKSSEYISEVRTPEDKYRVGACAHMTMKGETKVDAEIIESLENQKITYRFRALTRSFTTSLMERCIFRYILEPVEEGTRLAYVIDYEAPWWMGILDKLTHRSSEKELERSLGKLKSILEK